MHSEGVRIGNETLTYIAADKQIRPLRDQIIVEPLPWQADSPIAIVSHAKPLRGVVRAVGPGCHRIQYQNAETGLWSFSVPKGKRKAMRPSKVFRPCDVRVGDIVELGGLEWGGYLHMTVNWGGIEMVVCREEDVCGIVNG